MSKNLTRKGIALGAVVALGTTLFAGAPAFAADEVTLAPAAGSLYKTISGEAFVLNAGIAPSQPAGNIAQLKYLVTSTASPSVTTNFGGQSTSTTGQADNTTLYYADTSGHRLVAGDAATVSLTATAVSGTPSTATVVAFLDANGDGLLTTGEFSKSQTITWVNAADVTTSVAVTKPLVGDTTVSAKLTVNDINTQNIPLSHFGVVFDNNYGGEVGAASSDTTGAKVSTSSTSGGSSTAITRDATTGVITAKSSTVSGSTIAASDVVKAQAVYTGADISAVKARVFTRAVGATGSTSGSASLTMAAASTNNIIAVGQVVTDAGTPANLDANTTVATVSSQTSIAVNAGAAVNADLDSVVLTFATPTLGAAVVSEPTTATVGSVTAFVAAGPNAVGTAVADATENADFSVSDSASAVRANTEFTVKALVKDTATTKVALSGAAVTATITTTATGLTSTVGSEKQITVAGTTYSTDATLAAASVALTSDASGYVSVKVSSKGLANTDTITVTFTSQNIVDSATGNLDDAAYVLAATGANETLSTTDGKAVSLSFDVLDQFGQAIADGYDVRAYKTATTQTTAGTTSSSVPTVNAAITAGKSSLSLVDDGTGVGTDTYTFKVEKRLTGGAYDSAVDTIAGFVVNIVVAADLAGNLVTVTGADAAHGDLSATTDLEMSDSDGSSSSATPAYARAKKVFASGSSRNAGSTTFPALDLNSTGGYDDVVNLSGTFTVKATNTASAINVKGAAVSVSGAGIQFVSAVDQTSDNTDEYLYGVGSLTTYTDGSGAFSLFAASNKAGVQTITITAGGVSQKVLVTFAAAGNDDGAAIVLPTSQVVKSGRTLVVTGSVTDTYGNVIKAVDAGDFSAVYTGPGYEFTTSPLVSVGSNGVFTIKVLIGAGEVGLADVAVTYNPDTLATGAATKLVSATQTILIGVTASVSAGSKAANVVVKNAAGGSVKVVSGSKVVSKVATSDSFKISLTKLTAGKKTVKVYVNDVLVSSKSVAVKK